MFPMWFFIVLILLICSLLYLTQMTRESFVAMSKNSLKKFQGRKNTAGKTGQ